MTTATHDRLVSVVIPAHNAAPYLRRTVESVLAQTHSELEVLVIDDGSEDATSVIAWGLARQDGRIVLRRQEKAGVAAARNHGIREARGDFIATLDADDLWQPTKIEKQLARFGRASSSVGLVYCWSSLIDENDRIVGYVRPFDRRTMEQTEGRVMVPLVYKNFVGNGSAPLIRRECFERAGLYDASLLRRGAGGTEDYDMYLRLAERYEFAVVPEFLVGYRQAASTMSTHVQAMKRSHELVLTAVFERHRDLPRYVRRWSRAHCSTVLASKCLQGGSPTQASRWAIHALVLDPTTLLRPGRWRRMARVRARDPSPLGRGRTPAVIEFRGDDPAAVRGPEGARRLDLLSDMVERRRWKRLMKVRLDSATVLTD
jgi:glycosyltransferase involved in cell wall biosynthesis